MVLKRSQSQEHRKTIMMIMSYFFSSRVFMQSENGHSNNSAEGQKRAQSLILWKAPVLVNGKGKIMVSSKRSSLFKRDFFGLWVSWYFFWNESLFRPTITRDLLF